MSKKILVIDDEFDIRNLLKEILEACDHKVETACSGNTGVEAIKNGDYDIVITDWTMPDGKGEVVVNFLIEEDYKIPLIVHTGYEIDMVPYENYYDINLIKKPADLEVILDMIETRSKG